jgi:hypothetical protein
MSKFLRWSVLAILAILVLGLLLRHHYVLDTEKLDAAIKTELPPGTPKAKVIQFIQARKPMFWEDLGTHVKTRMTGRAGNLIYSKDIVLDFEFDGSGRLVSFSKKVDLGFL